jgi:hypothetical protein
VQKQPFKPQNFIDVSSDEEMLTHMLHDIQSKSQERKPSAA